MRGYVVCAFVALLVLAVVPVRAQDMWADERLSAADLAIALPQMSDWNLAATIRRLPNRAFRAALNQMTREEKEALALRLPRMHFTILGVAEFLYSEAFDPKMADWRPTKENDFQPMPALRSRRKDITVDGTVSGESEDTRGILIVKRVFENTYTVEAYRGGCLPPWKQKRSAVYSNGVLLLDSPIQACASVPYRRLYVIDIQGDVFLVPDANIPDVERYVKEDGTWDIECPAYIGANYAFRLPPNKH